jgi:predicted AlkP superfamily pyrophosphatase or phosphodiesterase
MRRFLLLFLSFIALAAGPTFAQPLTVLISIDGFRADYLWRGVTPNMSAMAEQGASGAMRPSFPSKTFPNHYALITGLRPDRNGIVENNMEDPAIPGVLFKMSNHDAVVDRRWWDQGEPLWVVRGASPWCPTQPLAAL